ncbi:methyltransferase domain-containing protein [Tamlana haliotis]|uniref:Methyltransferase domain-containing protein n=1 Tax=Pseudotamlana haliotis TaxID=2614804 RepID=A0A6N6M940_9FLAO|nr:methyltransferase domain-containing protein [Tamlana haliotis]KAB1067017.1 methyltransferase domain-containing protein [Tamlana haliotis]
MKVKSPITSGSTKLLKKLPISYLSFLYSEGLGVSIEEYFNGLEYIYLYQCVDTGYKFYYPFNIAGQESFYKKLELDNNWYYQKWKWEYEEANSFIKEGQRVLEVGCGRGHFLDHLKNRNIKTVGLELNKEAMAYANENDINVLNKLVEEYSKEVIEKFDVVCAFQLLEHIWDIDLFLTHCMSLLKPKGLLIFAVPNNDAFFFNQKKTLPKSNVRFINQLQTLALNMPPHHMGLWDKKSLKSVADHYSNLESVCIKEEPIHVGRNELNTEILKNLSINKKIFNKLKKVFFKRSLVKGDSLLVVYEKK